MNLQKAIKINIIHNDHNPNYTDKDREDAHQLGIEALKRIQALRLLYQALRLLYFDPPRQLLPGETED